MTTKNLTIDRDIFKKQQDTITELRDQLEQRDRHIEYLERRTNEYDELLNIATTNQTMPVMCPNPQCGIQMQVPVSFMQILNIRQSRINYQVDLERTIKNQTRAAEQAAIEAERQAKLEEQVLAAHPELPKRLERDKAELEKDRQSSYNLINRWFDMSEEDFNKYLSHSTKLGESPVQNIIKIEESDNGKSKWYSCNRCYGSSYLSLNLVERHIFTEDHETHRDAVLEQIDKTISAQLVKFNAEYKQDIRNYAQSKIEQDNANRLKAAKAAEKREKDKLPFLR